jgi:monofunctional glycosyltransferase
MHGPRISNQSFLQFMTIPPPIARVFQWIRRIALVFFIFSVASVVLFSFIPPPFTPLMIKRLIDQATDGKREMRLYKSWTRLEHISTNLQVAVICGEDQSFLEHQGFDFKAIEKALKHNKKSKKKRGASTISQQTAKNVFLWPSRSWLRKGFELYFTTLIEACWDKARIFEVYLNVAEWGDGIYGAEAASQHYFKKPASALSREEASLLASVLPGPLIYSVKNPNAKVRKKQHWIIRQMRYWGGEVNFEDSNTPGLEEPEEDAE